MKWNRKIGTLLIAAWLIAWGLPRVITQLHFENYSVLLGVLAIAAGVCLLLDR
jgi:hypothetical protein